MKYLSDFPEIIKEFDCDLNININPNFILYGSNKKYWWKCNKGHSWESRCDNRTINKRNCPYCCGQKVCKSNSLSTNYPNLICEWDKEKNELTPDDVTCGSSKKIWWKCVKGHMWKTSCKKRTNGTGCPYCCGKKVDLSNCLATTYPDIASQWHPTKNNEITPYDVVANSNKKFWFICKINKNHEWIASPNRRVSQNSTCPYCCGQKVDLSNCLATTYPDIASQWHPTKNNEITPYDVVAGCGKKIWWLCEKNHSWAAYCYSRTGFAKNGCPYCCESKGEKLIKNYLIKNSIEFTYQYKLEYGGKADFYIKHKNFIIEFQGEQHYIPTYFGGKKSKEDQFYQCVENDFKKRLFCKNNNISIFEIPFWEKENIVEILDCKFNNKEYLFSNPPDKVKTNKEKLNFILDKLQTDNEHV
jgi:hypothetical protein